MIKTSLINVIIVKAVGYIRVITLDIFYSQ